MTRVMITVFAFSVLTAFASASDLSKANQILRYIDKGRAADASFEVVLEVSNTSKNTTFKYKLLDNGKDRSVLYFLDESQRGQKVLATSDETWFFSSRTKRAIKIPSIQKLFGEASIGDIARLRFSQDYAPTSFTCDEKTCQIEMKSVSPQSTYAAIDLWVTADNWLPVKAKLFAASGKHLKNLEFTSVRLTDDTPVIDEWRLFSPDNQDEVTIIRSSDFALVSLPSVTFTKPYLLLSNQQD